MSRLIYFLIWLLPMFAIPAGAAGFDCAKAGTPVEKLICSDPLLSGLDEKLARAYKAALSAAVQGNDLRRQQKEWLENVRNRCTTKVCLADVYERRLKELTARPSGVTGGEKGEQERWLTSKPYGSDNEIAALREVRIWQEGGKYHVHIRNQFSFQCELTFDGNGMPARLARCESTLKPGDEWYDGTRWAVREDEVALTCAVLKREVVCRGEYTLLPNASRDRMTIARKR
jgi:uncharacterized protein